MSLMDLRGEIWVVDDSAVDANRVAAALDQEFVVKIFQDGPAALEALASTSPPDLLLLDWVMPGMSGVEICRYIRTSTMPYAQIPIILLTAQRGSQEIEEAFQSGANDYLGKPFVAEELKARVRTVTSANRHLGRAQTLVKELQRSEERLLLATSSGGVGIWEWDISSGLVTSTDIHRKIFGLPDTPNFPFSLLLEKVVPDDRTFFQKCHDEALENKSDCSAEFRIQKSDGSIAWIYGHGRSILDEKGVPSRMVGIHLDITSQKNTEEQLKRAKVDAERANQMKSAFLANMSHEIRTPLGAMLGFAHLMKDPSITEMELSQYLEVLTRNGEQLSVIIDDILDLSKVEAGQLTFENRVFDPAETCNDVASLFRTKAKEKGLTLEYIKDPSTPDRVTTDPTRLRQILTNLVNNALKFTRVGHIKIRSYSHVGEEGNEFLRVEVIDTGIGVPQEHAERIFDMFVQGDDSITRKFGGTGIGLSLSRQLARELGGDLTLVKTGPSGSTFLASVVNVPGKAAAAEPRQKSMSAAELGKVSLTGIRVLVVDDAPDNQHLLNHYLSKHGASVALASNGIEGYTEALRNSYDIVLMDLQMPLMDGYTATKNLRKEGYPKPIIALTAHAMSEVSAKCIEAGCNGYLPKPINPTALLQKIAEYVKQPVSAS